MRISGVFVGLSALVALEACTPEGRLTDTVAEVERLRAAVDVTEPSQAARPVERTARLARGATVHARTGRALVRLDHGEGLLLDQGARVTVSERDRATLVEGRAWVTRGTVRADADPDPAVLESEGVTLRLRGAQASVSREGANTVVDVIEGEIAYEAGSRRGAVRAGERARLSQSSATVAPRPLFDDWTGGLADNVTFGIQGGETEGLGAVAARRPDEAGAPRWPLALQRVDAHVTVLGDLAITELEQTFFNPAGDTVEGLYTLMVPRGAVLQRFAVDRRGTLVDGVVQERQSAAAAYQAQVYRGSTFDPALLEWDAPGRYHARLYPIQPAATRRIVVRYTQWLPTNAAGLRSYRLPLATLGTRVGELRADLDLRNAGAHEVRASAGARRSDDHVTLAASDTIPTSDFVVEMKTDPLPPASYVRVQPTDDATGRARTGAAIDRAGFIRVAVQAPAPAAREARDEGVDLVIVADHSAATEGTTLQLQQAMAEALVRSLSANDRILVLAGDVATRPAGSPSTALRPATAETQRAILDALSRDRRGGATDLGAMLEAAHSALDPQRNGAVLYLGDGLATVGERELPALRARLARMTPRPRLYAIAVGDAPRLDLLAGLTEPSGFSTRVTRRGEIAGAALDILAHVSRPLVRNFRVDLGPSVERVYPTDAVDLPAGEPLIAIGRLSGAAPRTVTVRASWQGRDFVETLALQGRTLEDRGDLRLRWATERLDHLLARGESRMVVVELGTRFGLITPFTSLFVPGEDQYQYVGTQSAREPFSVFDLLPLVGCTRSADRASREAPAMPAAVEPLGGNNGPAPAAQNVAQNAAQPAAPAMPSGRATATGATTTAEAEIAPAPPPVAVAAAPTPEAPAEPAPDPAMVPMAQSAPAAAPMPTLARAARPGGGGGSAGQGGFFNGLGANADGRARGHASDEGQMGRRVANARRGPTFGSPVDDSVARQNETERGGEVAEEQNRPVLRERDRDQGAVDGDFEGVDLPSGTRMAQLGNGPAGATVAARVLQRCSDAAAVTLAERIGLWRERLATRPGAQGAMQVWAAARRDCELPAWPDRVALLRTMVSHVSSVDGQLALYRAMRDPGARGWLRDVLLRTLSRSGELARASELGLLRLDNETLTAALARVTSPAERVNVLRQLTRRYPDDLDLAMLLLDAAATARDRGEVQRTATRLREDPRTDARVRTAAGEALLSVGDEAEARRTFSEIVEFAPDDPFARRRLGDIALAHGWADEAYRQYQTLAAQLADAPEILLRLAAAARAAGRLDEAIRLAERVVTQSQPGVMGTVTEAAVAWIATELGLAGASPEVSRATLDALRARWRRSPAARTAGALRAIVRWQHPDDDAELWLTLPDEPARRADLVASIFPLESTSLLDAPARLGLEVRRGGGARPRGDAELIVIWNEGRSNERVSRQVLHFDPDHPRLRFEATEGQLQAVTVPGAASPQGGAR